MSEGAATVDGVTHPLPRPFFVIATQNPLEHHGTHPLPESQLDRFLMRLHRSATRTQDRRGGGAARGPGRALRHCRILEPVLDTEIVLAMQPLEQTSSSTTPARTICCDIGHETREHERWSSTASPRGARSRCAAPPRPARWWTAATTASPRTCEELAVDVLAHRVLVDSRGGRPAAPRRPSGSSARSSSRCPSRSEPGRVSAGAERVLRWLRPPRTLRPTRAGWAFFAITFGVGFAALNTGNNLLYLVLSLMLAFLVLSGRALRSRRCAASPCAGSCRASSSPRRPTAPWGSRCQRTSSAFAAFADRDRGGSRHRAATPAARRRPRLRTAGGPGRDRAAGLPLRAQPTRRDPLRPASASRRAFPSASSSKP